MANHHTELIDEIAAFLERAQLSETTFGRLALKDPHFVRDLRKGRRLWPETEQKIRDFMSSYSPADIAPSQPESAAA